MVRPIIDDHQLSGSAHSNPLDRAWCSSSYDAEGASDRRITGGYAINQQLSAHRRYLVRFRGLSPVRGRVPVSGDADGEFAAATLKHVDRHRIGWFAVGSEQDVDFAAASEASRQGTDVDLVQADEFALWDSA